MIRERHNPSSGLAARLTRCATLGAVMAVTVGGCAEQRTSPLSVELPLFSAAQSGHTGTHGRTFSEEMSQEVTSTFVGDPDGVGSATITMNAGLRTVCWSLTASNIALPATASHIHRAVAGFAGPIVLGLTAPGADGTSAGCAENVNRDLIVEILSRPSLFYVNVHTTEHPPGAIRAQLD